VLGSVGHGRSGDVLNGFASCLADWSIGMTNEDIIRMAVEAGFADAQGTVHAAYQLEAFAHLVAAAQPDDYWQEEARRYAANADFWREKAKRQPLTLDCYDAGLLSDFGGGNVDWWQDYIRAELDRAHDFYQSQAKHGIGDKT
jgi:hypothetical protein